jgi:hypothetical protein
MTGGEEDTNRTKHASDRAGEEKALAAISGETTVLADAVVKLRNARFWLIR